MRVVAVDFSLTNTGVAVIEDGRVKVKRCQSKPTGDTLAARSLRMRRLAGEIVSLCAGADSVVVEGPAYASDTGKAHDRSGCWWMIVGHLTAAGIPVTEVPPATLKVWALGTGRGDKDLVLATTIHNYGHLVRITSNDTADAVQLASLGWHHLTGNPLIPLSKQHTRALASVRWAQPEGVTA